MPQQHDARELARKRPGLTKPIALNWFCAPKSSIAARRLRVLRVGADAGGRVAPLVVRAGSSDVRSADDDEHRRQRDEQRSGHGDGVQRLAQPPARALGRGARRRAHASDGSIRARSAGRRPHAARIVGQLVAMGVQEPFDRAAQLLLVPDLLERAPDRVDVAGVGTHRVRAQEGFRSAGVGVAG